ncbi:MAG: glycosyltransferase, partial [Dehalococcoidia bacterium]|nr:glycosyltransferase [Dehalococcoidia bacterium]
MNKGLRFLFVNIGYHPFTGGSQLYCQWLAESLVKDGHHVTVYTTTALEVESIWNKRKPHLPPGRDVIEGVEVIRYPIRHLPPSPYSFYLLKRAMIGLSAIPFVPKSFLKSMSRFTPWVPEMSGAFNSSKDGVDLLHLFTIPFESLMIDALSYADRLSVPVVVTPFVHTGAAQDKVVKRGYTMLHQMDILRSCRAVTVLTDIEGSSLAAMGVAKDVIFRVGAGIPLDQMREPFCTDTSNVISAKSSYNVLFLGAATYEKGAVHLLEAVRLLNGRGVDVHLFVAGTVVEHFKRHIRGIPDHERAVFTVLGKVTEEEKHRLLASCDLLAMPSRVDSFGLVY